MQNTDDFISKYRIKILLIEDKIEDIKSGLSTLLDCGNIYDIYIEKNEIKCEIKFKRNDKDVYIQEDHFKYFFGFFVFNPNKTEDAMYFFNKIKENKLIFDIFLIDLKLKGNFNGEIILSEFKKRFPDVPVFVFTWDFSKDKIIETIKQEEADGFIVKAEIKDLEKIFSRYFRENFGIVWEKLREYNLYYSRILAKGILTWRRNPNLLWFGDKTSNTVEHTYQHSNSMFKLLNKFIEIKNDIDITPEYLFYLAMSIWVHDIGIKGDEKNFWCYEIRKYHPLITGSLLYKFPDIYLFSEDLVEEEKKKRYKENVSLISAYHKFTAPLVESHSDFMNIDPNYTKNTKYEYIKDIFKNKGDVFYIESIDDKNLVFPAALLRFIDVLDKGVHRTGIQAEQDVKLNVCYQDTKALLEELNTELEKFGEQLRDLKHLKVTGNTFSELKNFINNLASSEINEIIEKFKELIQYLSSYNKFENENKNENDNDNLRLYIESYNRFNKIKAEYYDSIKKNLLKTFNFESVKKINIMVEQLLFLLESPLHYITHRSFKEEKNFEKGNDNSLNIIYYFNDDFVKLKNLNFEGFNRLFQESWKVFTDIQREYEPLIEIFKKKNIKFKDVKFCCENNNNNPYFNFSLDSNYAEFEFRLSFKDTYERENFLEKLLNIYKLNGENEKSFDDTFYDDNFILYNNGWSLRKRKNYNNQEWSIKIKPLYWKGEYEFRLVYGIKNVSVNDKIKLLEVIRNVFYNNKKEEDKDKEKKLDINEILNIKNELIEVFTINQKRKEYKFPQGSSKDKFRKKSFFKDVIICEDDVSLENNNEKKLYLLKFKLNSKDKPWEQEKVFNKLKQELYKIEPDLDKFIMKKTKFEWAKKNLTKK